MSIRGPLHCNNCVKRKLYKAVNERLHSKSQLMGIVPKFLNGDQDEFIRAYVRVMNDTNDNPMTADGLT